MAKKKRSIFLLLFGMITLTCLGSIIYNYNPQSILPEPLPLSVKPVYVFFLLLFSSLSSLASYISHNTRRGIFFGLFVCSYLFLRLNQFSEIYFVFILVAFFVSLELFFTRYH